MDVFSGVRRVSAFAEGAYDVTGGITAYGEFLFSNRKSHNNGVQRIELQQFTGESMLHLFMCHPAQTTCDTGDMGEPLTSESGGTVILRPRAMVTSVHTPDHDHYSSGV